MGFVVEAPARAADCWALLERAVEVRPDHRAVVAAERTLRYDALHAESLAVASGLAHSGVSAGDVVMIALGNIPEFVSTFLALQYLRAVSAPINPAWTPDETTAYAGQIGARYAVMTPGSAAEALRGCGVRVAMIEGPGASLSNWRAARSSGGVRRVADSPDSPALMQPSSGSMGKPKIAVRSSANLVVEAANLARTVGFDADDTFLAVVPLHHCHGLGNCLQASLSCGGTLVLSERFDHHESVRLIVEEGVTVLPGVPFMFGIMAEGASGADLSGMKLCFSAGGPLPETTYRAFTSRFRTPVRQLYGCTEAGSVTVNVSPDPDATCGTVGRPIDGVAMKTVDDESNELPAGQAGEILFRSGALMGGYLGADPASALHGGFFRTGDVGVFDDDGLLTIRGRRKVFIDVGAQKVDPAEIEDVIRELPAVEDVVVVGAPTRFGDETIKAVVVARDSLESWRIVQHCRERLSLYKCPKQVEFRDSIPRSPLGKVLRGKL